MNQVYQFKQLVEQDFPDHTIPDLLDLYQFSPEKYPFLLQSTVHDVPLTTNQQSRYDILFIQPQYWLKMDKHFQLSTSENLSISLNQTFLQAFDDLWYREQQRSAKSNNSLYSMTSPEIKKDHVEPQLPFTGGWFVFFAYELAQQVEPGLKLPVPEGELPVAYAARVSRAIIHDHHSKHYFLLNEKSIDLDVSYQELVKDIKQSQKERVKPEQERLTVSALQEDKDAQFITAAAKVRHYIREGDVFQVNLSRSWKSRLISQVFKRSTHSYAAALLYRSLRKSNPAPFSGLVSFIDKHSKSSIISSSPERLLTVRNNIIESRPIAGTRPRSPSVVEDKILLDELHAHPKEQAEHVMLIDLIRNDLGRVCEPGTVRVDEFMVNESYAHVHHIVSNVIGRKQKNKTPGQVIKAIFPGGTITGCPKVRCMEIIAELEKTARSAYTGSMGYINMDGSMDLNILIRTMQLEQIPMKNTISEGTPATSDCLSSETAQLLSLRAGAGLVADSIAENELHETRAKAKGLLRALEPFLQAKHWS